MEVAGQVEVVNDCSEVNVVVHLVKEIVEVVIVLIVS